MIQQADSDYLRRLFVKAPEGFWHRHLVGVEPYTPQTVAPGVYVVPLVNASRWMVVCPTCGAGQLATPEFPRFFCVDCLNTAVDGAWIDVRWPTVDQRRQIESVLLARPLHETRSWFPHETIGALVAENHIHGNLVDHDAGRVLGDPRPPAIGSGG